MKKTAVSAPYRNQATQRLLNLLSMFAGLDETYGVSELSRASGMNKNMVHRMLATLVEAGYVVRDVGGDRYQLGYRILDMPVDDETLDLRSFCRPTLEELHRLTGESVFLSIIVGASRVNVDWIEGEGRRVSMGQRGRAVPLHCTAMSRVLLAHLSDSEIKDYLTATAPLDQFQIAFPDPDFTTAEAIWRDLRAIRGMPYVCWRSVVNFSAAYITFPIPGADNRLHGILTIGGPVERFDPNQTANLNAVRASVENLQRQSRFFVPPPFMAVGIQR